ncbi:hypothetical protein [Nonomuraea lactucae]|uniref:hypothetical protein n=1 Tax=Nonomuraea lactucae TaxID=2249762 RepID=UPI0013B44CAF|nr:hypothetical protein [Nonomuraea lactucae]
MGKEVEVKFVPSGVDDERNKSTLSLTPRSGKSAGVIGVDGGRRKLEGTVGGPAGNAR